MSLSARIMALSTDTPDNYILSSSQRDVYEAGRYEMRAAAAELAAEADRRLEVAQRMAEVYLRTRMRKERPELLPMLAEVLALVELATRKPEPITVPRLSLPFAPTEFAGRSVRGDTLPATLMGPL